MTMVQKIFTRVIIGYVAISFRFPVPSLGLDNGKCHGLTRPVRRRAVTVGRAESPAPGGSKALSKRLLDNRQCPMIYLNLCHLTSRSPYTVSRMAPAIWSR